MTILYLTYYFYPDLSAGSFRNTPFVDEVARQLTPADTIHVITTQPNRYSSYNTSAPAQEDRSPEEGARVWIKRVSVPAHTGGMASQIQSFATYFQAVHRLTHEQQYDRVMVSSSRLFTAFLGAQIARRHQSLLSLDIRDLFRESILDVLKNRLLKKILDPALLAVERYTFRRARHINLVSAGFQTYFTNYPQADYSFFTNGIDDEFLTISSPAIDMQAADTCRTILYAGNIGEGQGLHTIIPQAARLLGNTYRFVIIGDGGARHKLETALIDDCITNVALHPPVSRHDLLNAYAQADYLFVHLNDLDAFKRVLPSKLFDYGATDKPILAGVSGYAAQFVHDYLDNTLVFAPGHADELVRLINKTPYNRQARPHFVERFQRRTIMADMARHWLQSTTVSLQMASV